MRNTMTFTDCRQYVGESTISFGPVEEPSEGPPAPAIPAVEAFEIPAGLFVELVLETPLKIGASVVGDQLIAHVRRDIKHGGAVVLPKGTRVTGRVMALDHVPGRSEFHSITIVFDAAEVGGKQANFDATLLGFLSTFPKGVTVSTSPTIFKGGRRTGLALRNQPPSPGGVFFARAPGRIFQLPKKTVILYETR